MDQSDYCDKSGTPIGPIKVEYASTMERNETHHMTPCKGKTYHSQLLSPMQMPFDRLSPQNFSTPKKYVTLDRIPEIEASECESSSQSYSFKLLPKFATPPASRPRLASVQEFVAKNPFDAELQNKLHLPIFSPSVFKRCVSPSKESQNSFVWTIDDLSRIHPAPIEETVPDHHSDPVFSPETESRTQQAIESYFCTTRVLQSPWTAPQPSSNKCPLGDPTAATRCAGTQTALSLPPVLPAALEAALLPYFSVDVGGQQCEDMDDSWGSVSALRRKLFHGGEEGEGEKEEEEEEEGEEDMSVVSIVSYATPAKYNPLFANVLCADSAVVALRSYGSPLPGSQLCRRSPSLSPIAPALVSARNRSSVSARLDFSDESMAVDQSAVAPANLDEGNDLFSASPNHRPAFSFSSTSPYSCTNPTQHDTGYSTETGCNTQASYSPGTGCNTGTGCKDGKNCVKVAEASHATTEAGRGDHGRKVDLWQPRSAHITSSTPSK